MNLKLNKNLTKEQVWMIILVAVGLLLVNGYLVYGVFTNDKLLEKQCPVPVGDVETCECFYNALVNGSNQHGKGDLRYCTCYPKGEKIDLDKFLEVNNGAIRNP